MKRATSIFLAVVLIVLVSWLFWQGRNIFLEKAVLKQMIERLEADSRVAEVLVTAVNFDETTQKTYTTIKFLEYDSRQTPLEPRYFTFPGNIIQFQTLVVRFDNYFVKQAHPLIGKSAYLFLKVFFLDGAETQEYILTKVNEVPRGYQIQAVRNPFEEKLWRSFWDYALVPGQSGPLGIRNAQIEAPGTMFIPGQLYTLKIEHDGGLRIDVTALPAIVRGENIP